MDEQHLRSATTCVEGMKLEPSLARCCHNPCGVCLIDYPGWLVCEDQTCQNRTRRLPISFSRHGPICPACTRATLRPEYSEKALYNQLCFYRFIFDWEHALNKVLPSDDKGGVFNKKGQALHLVTADAVTVQQARVSHWKSKSEPAVYRRLKEVPDKALEASGYSEVNLSKLFQAFTSLK
ncbi:hypothetical protein CRUP_001781 [Coryphaenoides rupestris]|nr:hypothetical protein CRUP_001781 [Coryphaenoides rupestris]